MDPKCADEREEKLCASCLKTGRPCDSCVRSLGPRIATNRRWLKLMAAAGYRVNPLAETIDPETVRAERRAVRAASREERKAAEAKAAQAMRITTLVSGQLARACTTRPVFAPLST